MIGLPIRRRDFDVQGFASYLASNGCEIGVPTNAYEVIRYRAYWQGSKRTVAHIVYAKENGLLTWMHGSQGHYHSFIAGLPIAGNKPPYHAAIEATSAPPVEQHKPGKAGGKAGRSKSAITREALLKRDGAGCWFCGETMGDDCTIEHLIPKAKGGLNARANYVLAHRKCNNDAADLPLVEKIALRARIRSVLA